jgi:excisionase family DNA binding protein
MSLHLTTNSAAAYLGVSEASVRRWADAGVLSVKRVGRRKARRFDEEDLRRFKAGDRMAIATGAGVADLPAPGGLSQLAIHDHIGTYYESDAGRLRLTLPFLREGLLAGQPCFLVGSPEVTDEYRRALSGQRGVDLEAAVAKGTFVIRSGVGSTARGAVATWEQLWWDALGRGATAIRVVGEMATYDGFTATQEMLDYEVAYDSLVKRLPVMTICQYDVRHFDGNAILGALQRHPDQFSKRIADYLV